MVVRRLSYWIPPQEVVRLAFRLRQDSEFLVFRGQRLTRRQVFACVEALAAGLQALGVRVGDRVVTLLPACPEAVYTMFLPSLLGTINVPLHPFLGEEELRYILSDSAAKAIITTHHWYGRDYLALLHRLFPDLPNLRYVVVRDLHEGDGHSFLPLSEVMSHDRPLHKVEVSADNASLILYTSGTTGYPKGAVHVLGRSWSLLFGAARSRLDLSPLRCLLLPFPPYHYTGLFGVIVTLLAGGKAILMDHFDPKQALEYIQTEKVSQIGGSPTMYRLLLSMPGQERYDLSSVQRLTFSTEPMPFDLAEALHERFKCNLENFYGTSESQLISWTDLGDTWERAATTVGKPVPGCQVRIVGDERRPLPIGQVGEIAAKTSQMMVGYYNDPDLTAQVLDSERWFYTGDLGYIGEDGYLRLVDRKKDLILRGGQSIYPAEIERYLERHPAIRRAAVIGVPNKMVGESIWAYLELHPGARLTPKDIVSFCRGQVAPFKIPDQVRIVERLPTTATNKIQKFRLREWALQESQAHDP